MIEKGMIRERKRESPREIEEYGSQRARQTRKGQQERRQRRQRGDLRSGCSGQKSARKGG
jgi:hypothetical protein